MLNKLWDLEQYSWEDDFTNPVKIYCCPAAIDFINE